MRRTIMKKFARCILILILVAILSGVGGYIYENNTMTPMYESVAKLYVVPGSQNEASIRAKNGGLNHDFMIIFSSKVVIESAQRLAGTSEDISEYLTVSSPADSNIVELKVVNPDQNTAKAYVDAVAKTAVKTTTIIPVESMQILSEGTSDGVATKPDLYYYTALIMGAACAVCVFIEIVVCLILCAFKKKEDHSDDEFEYEARFGRYAYPRREYIETEADSTKRIVNDNKRKASSDDILAAFDDDDDDEYDDSFLYQSSDNSNANVAESEKTPEAPVMESEEILEEAVKEAAATKEEYKPEPVVEAEPIQEAAPVVEEPILEKQDEPTLVDEEPAQIVVDTPVEEEQPEEEVKPVEEEQPEEEVKPVEEEQPEEEVKPVEEEQPEEEVKPVEEEQPEEEVKPVEEEQPEEEVKPVEEEQPEEEVKPVEEEQPEEEVKPVEEEQPEEEVKPVEEEQPEEKAEPVEEEQQAVEEVEPASKIVILGRIYK
jgi:capsular polysaccharide biosynthesis protein